MNFSLIVLPHDNQLRQIEMYVKKKRPSNKLDSLFRII